MIEVNEKQVRRLMYISGLDREAVIADLQDKVAERLHERIWLWLSDGDGRCAGCGNTIGWVPHTPGCRLDRRNWPEDIR